MLDFCEIVDNHSGVEIFYAKFHFQTQSEERGDLSHELKHSHGCFQEFNRRLIFKIDCISAPHCFCGSRI